ncbi:MAG: hypothetical protein ACE5DX_02235 [Candidatus Dojkabacteria bacterium]
MTHKENYKAAIRALHIFVIVYSILYAVVVGVVFLFSNPRIERYYSRLGTHPPTFPVYVFAILAVAYGGIGLAALYRLLTGSTKFVRDNLYQWIGRILLLVVISIIGFAVFSLSIILPILRVVDLNIL